MLNYDQFRQGDVLVEEIANILTDAIRCERDEQGRIVLAYGEVTGHAHAIHNKDVNFYKGSNDELYLDVLSNAEITHEEHSKIPLGNKKFIVIRQREFIDNEVKYVAD
ncbi:MAG: hypothetical protein SFU99_12890 [Saprospiraceae bacterium]|nr:hypothetical protein [Saprospiraceae bacterium]